MARLNKLTAHVLICTHRTCFKHGGPERLKELKRALSDNGMRAVVMITEVDCLDQCEHGPVMVVYPDGVWYGDIDGGCVRRIVEQHLKEGHAVEDKVLRDMRCSSSTVETEK